VFNPTLKRRRLKWADPRKRGLEPKADGNLEYINKGGLKSK
jgi:hypothetical protein